MAGLSVMIGGARIAGVEGLDVFTGRDRFHRRVLDEVEAGRTTRLALVIPPGPVRPLQLATS